MKQTTRAVSSEQIQRRVQINGKMYLLVKAWHFLDDGEQYHYINVYAGPINSRPIKSFRWAVKLDGSVIHLS